MDKQSQAYKTAKTMADKAYGSKSSAYKSGYIVKKYKELGGKYDKSKSEGNLRNWFQNEKWIDIEAYIKGQIKPCGDSKVALCRPLHGEYSIKKYNINKIKQDLSILKEKKKDKKTISWEKYKK